jgi:hypothetical protein
VQLGGGLFVALAVLLLVVMPEHGFKPMPREDRSSWQALGEATRSGVCLIRQRPILLTFLGITAFSGLFSEGYDRLWTTHLLQDFSMPTLGPLKPVVWFGIISVGSISPRLKRAGQLHQAMSPNTTRIPSPGKWLLSRNRVALIPFLFHSLLLRPSISIHAEKAFLLQGEKAWKANSFYLIDKDVPFQVI